VAGNDVLVRVQRDAAIGCAAMIAIAAAVFGWAAAAAVLGGGLLAGVSFLTLKSGIGGMTGGEIDRANRAPAGGGKAGFAAVKLASRYALLGFLAYVMIARLRLHPLGFIAGASSVVAAVAVEAGRLLRNK
jgi:hypothetical protein